MTIIKEISVSEFNSAFKDFNREDNFSYKGRIALYDYLSELSVDIGSIDLDVIALCCEYTEYEDLEEYLNNYSNTHDDFIQEKNDEFKDLINSDDDFSYKESEFLEWLIDQYDDEVGQEIQDHTTLIKIGNDLDEGFIIQDF